MTMPAYLLHRGRPGEAGCRVFPLTQKQSCVPGYFIEILRADTQSSLSRERWEPSVLFPLFSFSTTLLLTSTLHHDLQICSLAWGAVLLPCKLMKFCTLTVFLSGLLRSVIHKHGFTQREEAARGQCLTLLAAPSA